MPALPDAFGAALHSAGQNMLHEPVSPTHRGGALYTPVEREQNLFDIRADQLVFDELVMHNSVHRRLDG
jgi:hypothetical protein